MGIFDLDLAPQLDTYEGLYDLLTRPRAQTVTKDIEAVRNMSEAERQEFNSLRFRQIGSSDFLVRTPQVDSVLKGLRQAHLHTSGRAVGRGALTVTGEYHMGKTTVAVEAMRQVFAQYQLEIPDWRNRGFIPIVYVEVPSESTAKALLGRFTNFFGLPSQSASRDTAEKRLELVIRMLRQSRTKLIVIDELQNASGRNNGNRASASVLKSLTNSVDATVMFVGARLEANGVLADIFGRQLAARAPVIRLSAYSVASKDDWAVWRGIIRKIETDLGLLNHTAGDLNELAPYLWDRTQGSMGSLVRLLHVAAKQIILEGRDPANECITKDDLEDILLDMVAENAAALAAPLVVPAVRKKGASRARTA